MMARPSAHPDQELWKSPHGEYRVFITKTGEIGIEVWGRAITKTPVEWQNMALQAMTSKDG